MDIFLLPISIFLITVLFSLLGGCFWGVVGAIFPKKESEKSTSYVYINKEPAIENEQETLGQDKKEEVMPNWFVDEEAQAQISVAEQLISSILNKYKVEWYREISFFAFKKSKYGYYRFDFIFLTKDWVHIIEYDGREFHHTADQIDNDKKKNNFCKKNKIPLTRYNRLHYYHLDKEIDALMKSYNIQKK